MCFHEIIQYNNVIGIYIGEHLMKAIMALLLTICLFLPAMEQWNLFYLWCMDKYDYSGACGGAWF